VVVTMTPTTLIEMLVREETLTEAITGTGDTLYRRQFIHGIIPLV